MHNPISSPDYLGFLDHEGNNNSAAHTKRVTRYLEYPSSEFFGRAHVGARLDLIE